MIRILFLQTRLLLDGPGIVVRNIVRSLDRSRFAPVVASLAGAGPLQAWYRAEGIPTITFGMAGPLGGWLDLRALGRVRRYLQRERIHLVHTHLVRADIVGRLAARRAGVRAITTVHNTEEHHRSRRAPASIVRALDRATIRLADRVVAVSHAVARLLAEIFRLPPDRLQVIHNGIEPPADVPALDPRDWGVAAEHRLLCCVGRLHPQKGMEDLIRASRLLADRGLPVTTLLVGDGPLRPALAEQIARERAPVRLAGFQESVLPFVAASDLFVLPSRWEGFGLSIVEAMALGKPVVATHVGGIPEVVLDGVTGLLCPPADPRGLAGAIGRLLEDPALARRLGEAGRRRALECFTAGGMSRRYQALYRQVLDGGAGAAA